MTAKKPTKTPDRFAALYCRVSTVDQAKADFSSLNAQEQMLREHCAQKGWKVFKVYVDTKSGKNLDRLELSKLLDDAAGKKFNVVVATKLDRLSRSVKDFLELDEQFRKHGIDIVITTQHIDTTTPAGQMQRTIMMAFAQFEREMIAERTRESSHIRAEKGYWLGGNVPLGYDVVDKKLVLNKEEADLVRSIFQGYLERPSTKDLAKIINAKGYKTKIRTTRSGKKTGGKEFNYQLVHSILRNRVYVGVIHVNNESFKGLHEAIVDEVLFERVQKRLDRSTIDTFATYEGSPLLLLGTTKCGFCGKNLTTYFTNNGKNPVKHYYYRCTTISKQGAHKCPSRLVPASDLEEFSRRLMVHIARDKGFFESVTSQIKDNSSDELIRLNEERRKFFGNLSAIEKKIESLVDNFEDAELGKEAKKKIGNRLEELGGQKTDVEAAIGDVDRQIGDIQGKKFEKQALNQVLKEFDTFFREATMEQKKNMLKIVIEEIKVLVKRGENEGTLEFKIRGNGTIVKKWNEVVNQRGVSLTPHVGWLRG